MLVSLSPLLLAALLTNPAASFVIYPEAEVFNIPSTPQSYNQIQIIHSSSSDQYVSPQPLASDAEDDTPLPVLVWHGLGDSSDADGLKSIATLLDTIHPGTYVHTISLGADGSADRSASFFGNVTLQIEEVCETLKKDPILSTAPAVDALGFSQGGQFLRGLLERCEGGPAFRSLVTFGAQHNGISKFQRCKDGGDWVCRSAEALVRSGGVWANFVQGRIVPAQYFRDPEDLDNYLEYSGFLADVNNERILKNKVYKKRLAGLENFVMVMFEEDETVLPKESSWWAEVNGTTGEVTKLRDRKIYKEDWLGLKELDEKGGLVFEKVEGGHMQLDEKDLKRLFGKYFGPVNDKKGSRTGAKWTEEL